jgi:ribosome-binding protein aMBF1 (putative translation factor)
MENEEKESAVPERRIGLYSAMWEKGWSQGQLAAKAGIPRSSLSLIMTGRLKPYPRQIERLIKVLGEDKRELFL